jgi:multimeric flavodoxin WrbA
MGKKVLMIDGSFRKKNTYGLLLQIEKILKARGIEVEIINLFDYQIDDCKGCEACVNHKACSMTDDMPRLREKILDSDGVVMSSPVYVNGVTSRFKTFADRTNGWIHKPEMAGIPVLFVTTTTFSGIKEIKQFFLSYANILGVRKGGFISRVGEKMNDPVREAELSGFLNLLDKDKKYYSPAMDEIILFTVGKALASKSTKQDNRYWEEKQLLDKSYYYPCKMNICKKLFGKFMFKVISNAIK